MPESSGFIVVWWCCCSDAADDPALLPERCPGHDAPLMCAPIENEQAGPTRPGHACRVTTCPPTQPTDRPTTTAREGLRGAHR